MLICLRAVKIHISIYTGEGRDGDNHQDEMGFKWDEQQQKT
jgi:hypothetical protein